MNQRQTQPTYDAESRLMSGLKPCHTGGKRVPSPQCHSYPLVRSSTFVEDTKLKTGMATRTVKN